MSIMTLVTPHICTMQTLHNTVDTKCDGGQERVVLCVRAQPPLTQTSQCNQSKQELEIWDKAQLEAARRRKSNWKYNLGGCRL